MKSATVVGIILIVLVASALGAVFLISSMGARVGNLAPDFTLTDIDGNTFSLSDYRGKVVVIDFMATWCGPCASEMSHLKEIFSSYSDNQVVIMSIDIDSSESDATMRQFKTSYGDNWIFASGSDAGTAYSVVSIPTIYIIDTQGTIAYSNVGTVSSSTLSTEIDKLL